MEESTKRKSSQLRFLLACAMAIILIGAAALLVMPRNNQENIHVEITMMLEKIVKTSDLSTAVFKYGGIVEVHNPKKPKDIDYYINYKASVYAGVDLTEIQFQKDDNAKTITAVLPEVTIQDTVVDPESLDFIFMNKKANNASVTSTALTACEADIQQECTSESALLEVARSNAENAVRALTEPVIEQACKEYTLVIK